MNGIRAEVLVFQTGRLAWRDLEVDGCGYEECDSNYRRSWTGTPYYCVERVLEGRGWISDGTRALPLAAGDCFFYGGPGTYEYWTEPDALLRKIWIRYSGKDAQAASVACLGASMGVIADSRGGSLELAFESCRGEAENRLPDASEVIAGYLQVILSWLRRLRQREEDRQKPNDQLFDDFKALIDENYKRWKSAKWGSVRLPASESYLSRIFKARMGMSPHRYLVQLKMQHAAFLLTRSDWSIKRIAAEIGYDDPLYFSRAFRKEFGCAPSSMRSDLKA